MNEMGDTFKVNVLEEAVNNKRKYYCFGIQKISLTSVQQNYMPEAAKAEFEKRNCVVIGASCDTPKCILHGYPPQKTTEVLKV